MTQPYQPHGWRRRVQRFEPGPLPTARQVEVLALLASGLSNKMAATRLGISENTVKNHLTDLYARMEVNGATDAIALGILRKYILAREPDSYYVDRENY